MQIREYADLNEEQDRRSFFYTRWFCCVNKDCKTTLVMPARYKVLTNNYFPAGPSQREIALLCRGADGPIITGDVHSS